MTHPTWTHQKSESEVNDVTKENNEKKPIYRLNVTLSAKSKSGVEINVSAICGSWDMTQKFLSEFKNTLLKGNNGKT